MKEYGITPGYTLESSKLKVVRKEGRKNIYKAVLSDEMGHEFELEFVRECGVYVQNASCRYIEIWEK